MLPAETAFKIYSDLDGAPLDGGYVYFGQDGQNPVTSPITVYWDSAGTQPAAQPLRTINGYIVRNGTPANVFIGSTYSQLVQDKAKVQVYFSASSSDYNISNQFLAFINNIASSAGSALIGFIQAGVGALVRTVQDKLRERICIADFAVADGTDETTAVQNFLNACAGKTGYWDNRTYLVTSVSAAANTELIGCGSDKSILKRVASAGGNSVILACASGVTLRGIGFDGNKSNQVNAANTVGIDSADGVTIEECNFINAKAVGGGFGSGLAITNGSGQTNKRKITIHNNRFSNNDAADIYVQKTWYLDISENFMKGSGGGVSVTNYVFPPVAEVQNFISISRNIIRDQAGSGIAFLGYVDSGASASVAKLGPNTPPQRYCIIDGNQISLCTSYGISWQGSNGTIIGNTIYQCGSVALGGGVLMNAYSSTFQGNSIRDCYHYGIDAGGSYHSSVTGNVFDGNCATYANTGTDINIGGGYNNIVSDNVITQLGAQTMFAIQASGLESDGAAPFPLSGGTAYGLLIHGNKIELNGAANSIGVWVYNSQERVTVYGNHVRNAAQNRAFLIEATGVVSFGNVDEYTYNNNSPVLNMAAASALIIPDVGNVFFVGAGANITSIRSVSSNTYLQRVRSCQATSHGSGYSRATPPTVSFSGGGGAGAAATAQVSYDGQLVGWTMTNNGSGYTSTPTATITHNGGAGGNCVPQMNCNNSEGREITIFFTGALTVTNGSNLVLNGNYNTTANVSMLKLMGAFDNWYEISRR
jgi:hypothetical protein